MTTSAQQSAPVRSPAIGELPFRVIVGAVAALVVIGIVPLRFCGDLSLPPEIAKPAPSESEDTRPAVRYEAQTSAYQDFLKEDTTSLRTGDVTLQDMGKLLPYRGDEAQYTLAPEKGQDTVETAGLRLTVGVQRVEGEPYPIMILSITNLTDTDLAYNVKTHPNRGTKPCATKKNLAYNGMAVAVGETQTRSECTYRSDWKLIIQKVETVALPKLSYFYVSKVPPSTIGVEARLARGHFSPTGRECNLMLPATVQTALQSGQTTWRDLIDFYARHRCETYSFPSQYKAFREDSERPLPAVSTEY